MKISIEELGTVVVYVISVALIISILRGLISKNGQEDSLAFIYNTNMLYANDFYFDNTPKEYRPQGRTPGCPARC